MNHLDAYQTINSTCYTFKNEYDLSLFILRWGNILDL